MKKQVCPLGFEVCCDTDTRYDKATAITEVEPIYTCYNSGTCGGLANYCIAWVQDGERQLAKFRLRCSAESTYRKLLNLQK